MPTERPLLTLAIPTYKRAGCLKELLDVLAPQMEGETRVELLVSDNCSPDDTSAVVQSFLDRGLPIRYNRNQTNLGADGNFVRCYEMAAGEYFWVFGDDDIIVPGGLQEVLSHLELREFDLLYLHAKPFRNPYAADAADSAFTHKLRVFSSAEEFALYAYTNLTFISGNIVRKSSLEALPHVDFRKLIGTNLVQLSWILSMLASNPKCASILDRVVANRLDNGGGHGTFHVFGTTLRQIVEDLLGLESRVGRAIINRTIQAWFPWVIVLTRRNRQARHLPEDAEGILKGLFRQNPRYWVFVHPVLRMPVPLAMLWMWAGKVINRLDGLMGYPIARA